MKDWNMTIDENTKFKRFQKTFEDGTDVIIYITQRDSDFVVKSLVETRTSGPVDSIIFETVTLDNAYNLAQEKCNEWDTNQNNNEEDWSKWKIKT